MKFEEAIIKIANKKEAFSTQDVLAFLGEKYSRQYISRAINQLVDQGHLMRLGKGPSTKYALPENADGLHQVFSAKLRNQFIAEHEVLSEIKEKTAFWSEIQENVVSIFDYAFSEMLNNAIDHSKSKYIKIQVSKTDEYLQFIVRDTGVGVFNNIQQKFKLKNSTEAIQELLKGKTTTAPKLHSGEGIFFTSKVSDSFILDSFKEKLTIDNQIPDIFLETRTQKLQGTQVTVRINLQSTNHLSDIFKKYTSSSSAPAFNKTEIQVKLYQQGTIYISRSQAKRILHNLDKFQTIILDFHQVPTVGQAFADEVFRVFRIKHPHITIKAVNANKAVKFMIDRVAKD